MKTITDKEKEQVCELYKRGVILKNISVYANLAETTCLKILREKEIPMRKGKSISPGQEKQVVDLYHSGCSIKEIIKESRVKSEQTIYRILRDYNVERRRNKQNICF